jgi:2-octaprenyl-6-methoxyphenol hydroxylase
LNGNHFDIVIVGGGMVGGSLAAALQHSSLKIALVDASLPNTDDPRLIALNYNSVCFFKNCGVWDYLSSHATAIQEVHISDRGHFSKVRLRATDVALPELGYLVPAKFINEGLYQSLSPEKITLFRPATLQKLNWLTTNDSQQRVIVDLGDQQITAAFVIGADGIHSTVRRELDIEIETTDYQQSALVTITDLTRSHQHVAYERFHKTGAIAMLPLTEQRAATILTDDSHHITELMALDNHAFSAFLQENFGYMLGRLSNPHTRYVFPLHMQKAKQHFKDNVLLIGNAAHQLHPIAAQGLNLAIAEIAKLAEEISAQDDLSHVCLENYFAWQKQQESLSTRFSHHLPSIFASDFPLTKFARQLALFGLNLCSPLKKRFTLRAMGRKPGLPSLLLSSD